MQVGNFGFGDSGSGGGGGTPIVGGGTLNYVSKFTPNGTTIANSLLYDNGTSVGLGTNTPDASALLDLSSTTQGFAAPRMTTLQRDAIVAPVVSLLIFNTSSGFYNYWDGVAWIQMDTSTGGDVSGSGTTNYAVKWTDGTNSVIGDGTWAFSGNDYYPVTTGANIGDATHRIGTIFMASVFDYANNLTFYNGTSTTMTLTTGGQLGIGTATPTSKLDVNGQVVAGLGGGVVTSNDSPFYAVRLNTGNPNYYSGFQYVFEVGGGVWGIGMSYVNNEFQFLTNGGSTAKFVYGDGNSVSPNSKFVMDLNGGFFGANIASPTANIHAKGVDSTSSNYALKLDNSSASPLLYVRNDGVSYFGGNTVVNTNGDGGLISNCTFGIVNNRTNAFSIYSAIYVPLLNVTSSGNVVIGDTLTPTARLYVKGENSTSANYALKVDNSALNPLFYVRNDSFIGIGTASPSSISPHVQVNSTSAFNYIQFTGSSSSRGLFINSDSDDYIDGFFKVAANSASYAGSFFEPSGKAAVIRISQNDGVSIMDFHQYTANGKIYITSNATFTANIPNNPSIVVDGQKSGFGLVSPTATIHAKGIDNTLANYALKSDDSLGNPLLYVRNDSKVSIGKVATLTTLDVLGDTTNTLFKLNNANFAFADKLRIDNNGSFYSGSINAFGGFGTGTYTIDHLNYTFNTSFSTYLAFTNAGGAGNKTSYGIIGGVIGSADSDYRLVILNSDTSTISGSGLKVLSTGGSVANDGFDYYNYGVNINSSGVFTNSGSGTSYKIGLNVNVSNGEVNYAALFNGGNSGFGILNPTATIHIQGVDSTLANYSLKVDNSLGNPLLYVRNDGNVGIGTNSPLSKLYVNSSIQNESITLNNDDITGSSYFALSQSGGLKAGMILLNSNHPFIPKTLIVRNLWDNGGIRINGGSGDTNIMYFDTTVLNVGIGTTTPNASALLDLTSTTGSLLVPRMTTIEKNALTAVNGMILYDTTLNKFQGYEAGAWVNLV